jgi:hypothetical protein
MRVRFPARTEIYFFPTVSSPLLRLYTASYPVSAERGEGAEVTNIWNYTSTPPYE